MTGGSQSNSGTQKTEPWDQQIPYLLKGFAEADRLYGGSAAGATSAAPGGSSSGATGGKPTINAGWASLPNPNYKAPATASASTSKTTAGNGGIVGKYYPGDTVADLSDPTKLAQQMIMDNAGASKALMGTADDLVSRTLNGDYLSSGNPYLQAMYQQQAKSVKDAYLDATLGTQSTFAKAGRYGSGSQFDAEGRQEQKLMTGLSDLATKTYYDNYNDERARQMSAAGLVSGLEDARYTGTDKLQESGEYMDKYFQDILNADIDRWDYNQNLPYTALQRYMDLIQGNYGGTSTSKSKQSGFSVSLGDFI